MGIKLLADTAPKAMKDQKFESCFGRKIAIVVGRTGMETLTNDAGVVTRYVFDGHPPELKKQELAKRYSKREDATEDLNAAIEAGDTEGIEKYSKRTVKAIENIIAAKNKSSQGQLESFFKPVVNASAPPKRKEIEEEAKGTSTHNKSKAGGAKKK